MSYTVDFYKQRAKEKNKADPEVKLTLNELKFSG